MKKKILIADNSEDSLKYYRCALPAHVCITTTDGDEAVKKFIEEKPDLIILNGAVTNKDGFEIIKEIRALDAFIKIIMISSNNEVKDKAFAAGFNEFYLKPISPKQLRELTI